MKRVHIEGHFLQVTFEPDPNNFNNNSDSYTFTITTNGGQMLEVGHEEVTELKFVIVGPWELNEFLTGMHEILQKHDPKEKT